MAQHIEKDHLNVTMNWGLRRLFKGFNKYLIYHNKGDYTKHISDEYGYTLQILDARERSDDHKVEYVVFLRNKEDDEFGYEIHLDSKKQVIKTFQVL